jgi:hypothetical protein
VKISDFLFFQQPGVIYGVVIALIAIGAAFWLFGQKIHRLLVTVVFLGGGILAGWYIGPIYGVNPILAMTIGGLLGIGVGYWFFPLWLAILSSALIFLILLGLYSWQIAVPYLTQAAHDAQRQYLKGEIKLAPGKNEPIAPMQRPIGPSAGGTAIATPVGTAWQDLQTLVPKLSRARYSDWQSWQKIFLPTLESIWGKLSVIIPRLSLNMILLGGVAFIFGCILVLIRPVFLNIAYTSLLGTLLSFGGIGVLFTLRDTEQLTWLEGQYWILPIVMGVIWMVGIGLQYWMLPAPPPVEESEDDEEGEAEKPKGDKKKK